MSALIPFGRPDDLFSEFARRLMPLSFREEPLGEIRIDLDENDKEYTVRAEMPGVKKEDVHVEVIGNRVSISAEVRKDVEEKDKKGRSLMRETYRGSCSRSFTLSHEVDDAGVVAKLDNGVLTLALPKRAGSRSHQIKVQ